jgi:septal ring factor EnvC (AmiA/AmiB activator)
VIRSAAAGLLCVLAAVAAGGQESPPELAKAREAVRQLTQRLQTLQSQQADLGKRCEALEVELSVGALRVKEAEAEQGAAEQALAVASRAAEASRSELERAQEQLRVQLSLLAAVGRSGLAPLLLHALESGSNVQERVTVALAVFHDEKRRRDEAAALMERRSAALAELSRRREELAGAARALAQRRDELERTRERVVAQLAVLERQRRAGAVELAGAQENEERLERLWGVVAGRPIEDSSSDLRLLRGGLRWPVSPAEVIVGFGPHRDSRYGTITVSHGLVLRTPPGTRVLAVAAGIVSFARFFKGYGNLVIVHHGGEIYSLYARLASMFVHVGDRVGMGEPLGIVGREEGSAGNFYLEMRSGQRAEDPLAWLQPIGK